MIMQQNYTFLFISNIFLTNKITQLI